VQSEVVVWDQPQEATNVSADWDPTGPFAENQYKCET
jgi:hypothetical protein